MTNAGPIAHMSSKGPISGHILDESSFVHEPGMAILVEDHVIVKIDETESMESEFTDILVTNLEGKAVIPGLVDAHTHLLWAGDRSREISWKQKGAVIGCISLSSCPE